MLHRTKHIWIGILSAIVLLAVGAGTFNVFASPAPQADTANVVTINRFPRTAIPASDLSTEEARALLFMREEEKLARDVYNKLYELWGQRVFQNIALSEQQHMDQIKLLLDRYGLADPALTPGTFTDANLQALYDQLIAKGSVSLEEALKVGVLIEQTDIADLQSRLAQTDNADIQQVYNQLMNASYNHLNAFSGRQPRGGNGKGFGGNRNRP